MPFRAPSRPVGSVTRGTTSPNRLRRMDRWIAGTHGPALRRSPGLPVAVDLGYGAAPWTAVELLGRLRAVRSDVRVYGVEIDPVRVAAAQPYAREGLAFVRGGFEIPLPPHEGLREGPREGPHGGRHGTVPGVQLIRAANVLRQYDEAEVPPVWDRLCARLAPDGLLVEGTCDEIGRRHVWVALGPEGPRTVTFAARLASLETPSALAERLPKALIHRNVPGEPVHRFLRDFDRAWAAAAPYGALSARQRWLRAVQALADDWPLADGPRRWRQGEVTVRWEALAPRGPHHR
ncbi:class I SAM-dependent methyltransferase [Streptomyces iconiensis]|uniref:Class I SAM-dependent methyltransferase n=1 Tax=Streptomyces iconiensis TaxID=1384038 RepID=A0ABT7A5F5_9ACTN|nr:class I SAM-dependent methyltransferase [Streptomyces iconiensis]MDJ1135853.1 class I SAM-dependent methyltransferase [Streptomyces iconiensis]